MSVVEKKLKEELMRYVEERAHINRVIREIRAELRNIQNKRNKK